MGQKDNTREKYIFFLARCLSSILFCLCQLIARKNKLIKKIKITVSTQIISFKNYTIVWQLRRKQEATNTHSQRCDYIHFCASCFIYFFFYTATKCQNEENLRILLSRQTQLLHAFLVDNLNAHARGINKRVNWCRISQKFKQSLLQNEGV